VDLSNPLPLVSIVTPSFNQGRYLEAAIQSVLSQEYPRVEYIVVDGGSSDETLEIIGRYEHRLAWWVSEQDRGQSDAINKGFAHANGQILAWLNSDDVYLAGAVAGAVRALADCPECGLVYGQANYIDTDGNRIGSFPSAQTDFRLLRQGYVHIPQQAAFFRAHLWKQAGPLDASLYFAMDYDLWLRIAQRSRIQFVPRVWASFRLHDDAKTLTADDRCWPEMLRIHYRDGGSFFSVIQAKYYLRKLAGPLIRWRRRRLLRRQARP
jgi:glycosyltransferase involved in cell wall biosynthesis